ncbi:MAG TPA: hypothetical protein VJB34_07940 [Bdellovibrionota bacterium]|nr:hypothetical protein [Bdellovibrionota bacterium]
MKKNLSLLVLTLIAFSFAIANAARLNLNCNDSKGKNVVRLALDVNDTLLIRVGTSAFKKNSSTYAPALVSFSLKGLDRIFSGNNMLDLKKVYTQKNAIDPRLSWEELNMDEKPEGLDLMLETELLERSSEGYSDEVYQLATLTVHDFLGVGYDSLRNGETKVSSVSLAANSTSFATLSYEEGGMGYEDKVKLLCESRLAKNK